VLIERETKPPLPTKAAYSTWPEDVYRMTLTVQVASRALANTSVAKGA
jgi:hypothetical protein